MQPVIISLTTIPPRIAQIGPTLDSLLNQNAPIAAVILWVPKHYRRRDFGPIDLPQLPAGVELRRCTVDYGPATKILPAIKAFATQDLRILYCDDDRIYHCDWAGKLLKESERYQNDCIVEAGEKVEVTALRAFANTPRFRLLSTASLGIYSHFHRKKIRFLDPGHGPVDIAKGYGGVLVRPAFLPETAFEIPDLLWTVDDIWLSGQMALNGITIRKVSKRGQSTKTRLAEVAALVDFVDEGRGRDAANLACIRYFQENFGIWTQDCNGQRSARPSRSRASPSATGRPRP
jgi:hypothetical protein